MLPVILPVLPEKKMKKIITTISLLSLILYGIGFAEITSAGFEEYLTDVEYYQEDGFAKLRFTPTVELTQTWQIKTSGMGQGITFTTDSDMWATEITLGGWSPFLSTAIGFVESINEFEGQPEGSYIKTYNQGQVYEVFLTPHCDVVCSYTNFAYSEYEISETDYITIFSNGFTETFFYGEVADVYGCMDSEANNYDPEATIDDGSCEYEEEFGGLIVVSASAGIGSALGVAGDLFGDLSSFVYLLMGIPLGLGVIKKTIGLFHKR